MQLCVCLHHGEGVTVFHPQGLQLGDHILPQRKEQARGIFTPKYFWLHIFKNKPSRLDHPLVLISTRPSSTRKINEVYFPPSQDLLNREGGLVQLEGGDVGPVPVQVGLIGSKGSVTKVKHRKVACSLGTAKSTSSNQRDHSTPSYWALRLGVTHKVRSSESNVRPQRDIESVLLADPPDLD